MSKNWIKTAALSVILGGLGSFTYWLEFKRKPEIERQTESEKKLFSITRASIESLAIVSGGSPFKFVCNDLDKSLCRPGDQSSWSMTEPKPFAGDETNINSVLSSISSIAVDQTLSLVEETPEKRQSMLKEYGLDLDHRASGLTRRLELKTKDGHLTVAHIGNPHPIADKAYILIERDGQPDEGKVQLVPFYFKNIFDHDLNYWRNKRILQASIQDIVEIEIKGAGSRFKLKLKDRTWEISDLNHPEAPTLPADEEAVSAFLSILTSLKAKNFIAEDRTSTEGKKTLAQAKTNVVVSLKINHNPQIPDSISLTFLSAKNSKDSREILTASHLPSVIELDKDTLSKVDKPLNSFRFSRLIRSMDRYSTKTLQISAPSLGDAPLVIKSDLPGAASLLETLSRVSVKGFLRESSPPAENLQADRTEFTLEADGGVIQQHFVVWKKKGELYARDLLSARKETLILDSVLNSVLPLKRDTLVAPKENPSGNPQPALTPAAKS